MRACKYFYAALLAALCLFQAGQPAMAADTPYKIGEPIVVTAPSDASSAAPAPLSIVAQAIPTAGMVNAPPAAPGAVPPQAVSPTNLTPGKTDKTEKDSPFGGLYGVLIIIGILALIYFLAKWGKEPEDRQRRGRVYYGDPEDYPRPRGRTMSARERQELRDEHRLSPTYDESLYDEMPLGRRADPPFDDQAWNKNQDASDPMTPKYQRQSQATLILPSAKDKKTFADVAGQPEAIARLKEICLWLKQPEIYNRHNARLPRGILLVGPPGTGKTLCAQALAGETHGSMFSIAASTFVEMYVGVGASRVRALFADAKAQRKQTNKPVIIFIDELDAVGGARHQGLNPNSEREQTLNQLLVEMDGFSKNEGIIVVAATNRVDMIDPALRRKGRFDVEVHVDLPDVNGREAILLVHTRDKKVAPTVDFKLLAKRTFGLSGADLEAASNEAAIIASRQQSRLETVEREEKAKAASKPAAVQTTADSATAGTTSQPQAGEGNPAPTVAETPVAVQTEAASAPPSVIGQTTLITVDMFDEAISIVESGDARRERFQAMSREDKKQTAVHELGHAVVIHKTGGDPITKITILPRGRALGYVQTHSEADRWSMTETQMRKRITSAMAGRIAQEIFMQTVDTGAANDFEQANRLARKMVTQFGMSSLGHIFVAENGMTIGPALSDRIDAEVNKIVADCGSEARQILEAAKPQIEALVEVLLDRETIFGADFVALLEAAPTAETKSDSGKL